MVDADGKDRYRQRFDPRNYLRQYYSLPHLSQDDAAMFRMLAAWLRRGVRQYATALDFGCGPVLHSSFALAPWAARIDLADYLQENLAEIQLWIDETPGCHDWDALLRGVLECEGRAPEQLPFRKQQYRSRLGEMLPCDLRLDPPIANRAEGYELVTSFFCAECVGTTVSDWEQCVARIASLVKPGGDAFFGVVRNCASYRVIDDWFASVPLTEVQVVAALVRTGFAPTCIETLVIDSPEWADAGFQQIIAVGARDRLPPEEQR